MARIKKAPDVEQDDTKSKHTSATVYSHNGGIIRVYSHDIHGESFEDLAKQMAAQHHGSRIEVR